MQQMKSSSADPAFLLGLGIASGIAMAISAVFQGKAGAAGADALIVFDLSETDAEHEEALDLMKEICLVSEMEVYGAGNIKNFFGDYLDFHTVAFHNLVMLAFLLIVALRVHTPVSKGEIKATMWFVAGFCTISASMAHILKTNYANYYTCNIPVLETVRLAVQDVLGAVPAKLFYVVIVSGLNFAFVYGAYWLYRLCLNLTATKEKVK